MTRIRTFRPVRHRKGDRVVLIGRHTAKMYAIPVDTAGVVIEADDDDDNACRVDFGHFGDARCWGADLRSAPVLTELAPTG